jgi:hypothetical protein
MISPKSALKKAANLIIVGTIVGFVYGWVSPHMFPANKEMGFSFGVLHGAMMPIALPSLVMGKNVDIFSANNNGRAYKIGYICGINLCGLLFFGTAFLNPKRPHAKDTKIATVEGS